MTPARSVPIPASLAVAALAIASATLTAGAAPADEPTHELIDATLGSRSIRLLGWDRDTVTIIDENGLRRDTPIEGVLAVLRTAPQDRWRRPTPDELAGGTAVVVELTDGRRFIGSVGPWDSSSIERAAANAVQRAASPDALPMLSAGIETVPLESIGRILFDPWDTRLVGSEGWQPRTDDEIVFTNGDRLSGFLVAIEGEAAFDTGAGERTFSLDRIAEIRLGNPPAESTGPRLWLATGEIRDGVFPPGLGPTPTDAPTPEAGPDTDPDTFAGESLAASPSSDAIHAGWFSDRLRIPLADLERRTFAPASGRRWTTPPRFGSAWASPLGVPDCALDGPMRIEWRLPPEAVAFSTVAELGGTLDDPDAEPGPWADAVLRITVRTAAGERTIDEVRLSASAGRAPIAGDLPGEGELDRTLTVELLAGAHGPIQDRLLLRRPFLLGN